MGLAERLEREQQTTETLEDLTSRLPAVERQLTALTKAVKELRTFETISDQEHSKHLDRVQERLLSSITSHSANTPDASKRIESVESRLSEIERTLGALTSSIDGQKITSAVESLQRSTSMIERTTSSVAKAADVHAEKVGRALNRNGLAIEQTRDAAVRAIKSSATATEAAVGDNLRRTIECAEELTAVAERLQRRVWPALIGRLAIALLPLATILLMGVATVWAIVHGYQWAMGMEGALWLRIATGVGLSAVVLGSGAGLWWLAVRVRQVLDRVR